MAEVYRIQTRDVLEDAAGSWIARLEADDVSEEDRRRFAEWLAEDDRHRETFESMRQTWHRLDALGAVTVEASIERRKPLRASRHHVAWAAAATIVLTIGAAAWWQLRAPQVQYYQTAVGHQLTATLGDGSTIQLNTDTRIEVQYSSQERTVRLQRGEAHFTVMPDSARPFLVLAGNGVVRAIGTKFNVYLANGRTEVTVTEGIVEIAPGRDESTAGRPVRANRRARVSEGQRVRYDAEITEIAEISPPDLERRLAWRDGMLSFNGETLQQVVEQVSRYTEIDFVIVDPELRDLEVGGYFRSTDVDALTELLGTAFQVDARREGKRIFLTRRDR